MDSTGILARTLIDKDAVVLRPIVTILYLSASLDITESEALCSALRDQLQEGAVALDGSRVERVSTACLQVIAAAVSTAHKRGAAFSLRNPSLALSSAIADLGLLAAIPLEH